MNRERDKKAKPFDWDNEPTQPRESPVGGGASTDKRPARKDLPQDPNDPFSPSQG